MGGSSEHDGFHLEQVGPYVIDERRSRSATFTTYRARHRDTGERVRLAVLDPEVACDETELGRFRNYANNLRRLNHEHLVSGVESGCVAGYHFLAMEHPDGQRLAEVIEREGPLRQRRALEIARQVAYGVRHLHLLGVVHGRVKAQNVLLTSRSLAKLGGLGAVDLTHAGATVSHGGPDDTEPVLITERPMRGGADVHGVGFTLLQMITGRLRPLRDRRRAQLTRAGVRLPDPSGSHTLQTDAILWRSISDEPGARFRDVDEQILAIDAALRELDPRPAVRSFRPTETSTAPLGLDTDPFETEPIGPGRYDPAPGDEPHTDE